MIAIVILVLFLVILILSGIRFVRDKNKVGVPGPIPLPLIGNALHLGGDSSKLMHFLEGLVQKYGDIVLVYAFSNRYLLLRNPKELQELIASTEHITKGESYQYLHPWLGQGLLTSTGHRWKTHRKLLTPAFHFNVLQTYLQFFNQNQKAFVSKLNTIADGSSFDLFPVVALVALDNVAESAMGVTVHAQSNSESEYVKAIAEISKIIMMRTFSPMLMIFKFLFNLLPSKRRHDKALNILHGHTNKVISTRHKLLYETQNAPPDVGNLETGIKKKVAFLDILLQSQMNGINLDMESIREEVDTFMFEGHDTTTSAICFTLYCISNNVVVQDKLLEEQRQIFGDRCNNRDASSSDLLQMKYLELVIKEALRLFPSVPIISRLITRDSKIAGIEVPKNTTVIMDIFHTQRDPRFFENPEVFRPERFLEATQSSVYSWIPFSAGPRNCIGQKFAMMEMKVVVSSIIRHFYILPSGIEPVLCSDLILRSKNGIHIRLLPRK